MPYCECGKPSENQREGGDCGSCKRRKRKEINQEEGQLAVIEAKKMAARMGKKLIAQVSEKQAEANAEYYQKKQAWIKGKRCAVYPELMAKDVHHMLGRDINCYADDWARENGINLLMDERFWLPVSRKGHWWIGDNDAAAREKGWVLDRLAKR